jgi:septum formation protein
LCGARQWSNERRVNPFLLATDEIPLVLGSGSPRRKEILTSLGVPFVVRVGDADETVGAGEQAGAYLERVALLKLHSVVGSIERGRRVAGVLVADTSVVIDGAILGKPATLDERLAMIAQLAGRTHEVMTRFVVASSEGEVAHAETVTTRVTFRAIDETEARAYAASGEGSDKAGGYAIQGRAAGFAERIDGSYACVVGLPACEVAVALRRLGLVA